MACPSCLFPLQGTCISLNHSPSSGVSGNSNAIVTFWSSLAPRMCVLVTLQLTSLDLSGLAAASDALAPTLVSLTNLVVLQLNRTTCSDATVEWLTYGQRLHQWTATAGRQQAAHGASPAVGSIDTTRQWPRYGATRPLTALPAVARAWVQLHQAQVTLLAATCAAAKEFSTACCSVPALPSFGSDIRHNNCKGCRWW